jgi:hypothetical protein
VARGLLLGRAVPAPEPRLPHAAPSPRSEPKWKAGYTLKSGSGCLTIGVHVIHRSIHDLKADIATFIQVHNADPKPFIWTKTADAILKTIARYCSDILAIHAATIERTSDLGH